MAKRKCETHGFEICVLPFRLTVRFCDSPFDLILPSLIAKARSGHFPWLFLWL